MWRSGFIVLLLSFVSQAEDSLHCYVVSGSEKDENRAFSEEDLLDPTTSVVAGRRCQVFGSWKHLKTLLVDQHGTHPKGSRILIAQGAHGADGYFQNNEQSDHFSEVSDILSQIARNYRVALVAKSCYSGTLLKTRLLLDRYHRREWNEFLEERAYLRTLEHFDYDEKAEEELRQLYYERYVSPTENVCVVASSLPHRISYSRKETSVTTWSGWVEHYDEVSLLGALEELQPGDSIEKLSEIYPWDLMMSSAAWEEIDYVGSTATMPEKLWDMVRTTSPPNDIWTRSAEIAAHPLVRSQTFRDILAFYKYYRIKRQTGNFNPFKTVAPETYNSRWLNEFDSSLEREGAHEDRLATEEDKSRIAESFRGEELFWAELRHGTESRRRPHVYSGTTSEISVSSAIRAFIRASLLKSDDELTHELDRLRRKACREFIL